MQKIALITGITGQDGSYLAELLVEKGYIVHGLIRRSSICNTERIRHLLEANSVILHEGDMGDTSSIKKIIQISTPDEIYNLAAMSHVHSSFQMPEYTADVNGLGVLRLLDACISYAKRVKFYQASTSELYGNVHISPQDETTPFQPRSPYAISKLFAYWSVKNYRKAYGVFACNGILFNHESPRRGVNFVTRKITLSVAKIAHGMQDRVALGNLDAKRDWGYAKDFVVGMWQMMQQETSGDYVLATGRSYTVREFVELAFQEIGLFLVWEKHSGEEKGVDQNNKVRVEVSKKFFRPSEVDHLIGDPSKAKNSFHWKAETSLKELVHIMVQSDLEYVQDRNVAALL